MNQQHRPIQQTYIPTYYEIRLQGELSPRWEASFEGMHIVREKNGETILRGRLPDQAALHGIFKKLRDAGLPLLSVNPIDPVPSNTKG